jgi:hypothetical protein
MNSYDITDTENLEFLSVKHPKGRYRLDSAYLELAWLPVIGPTATCFLRLAARNFALNPTFTAVAGQIEIQLGISGAKKYAKGLSALLARLYKFDFAFPADQAGRIFIYSTLRPRGS